jgi:hypothetical protein
MCAASSASATYVAAVRSSSEAEPRPRRSGAASQLTWRIIASPVSNPSMGGAVGGAGAPGGGTPCAAPLGASTGAGAGGGGATGHGSGPQATSAHARPTRSTRAVPDDGGRRALFTPPNVAQPFASAG